MIPREQITAPEGAGPNVCAEWDEVVERYNAYVACLAYDCAVIDTGHTLRMDTLAMLLWNMGCTVHLSEAETVVTTLMGGFVKARVEDGVA